MASIRKVPIDAVEIIRAAAWVLVAGKTYERILAWIGDAPIVLLGAATHGTHDFHAARGALTRRLIEDRGFSVVAIEGDWQDARQVNRYARGAAGRDPSQVLGGLARFPGWLWHNAAMAEFAAWLHEHNTGKPESHRVAFHGLDLFSHHASVRAAFEHLERADPALACDARASYACFDHFGADDGERAWMTGESGAAARAALVRQLTIGFDDRVAALHRANRPGAADGFLAEQLARLAPDAQAYYRDMLHSPLDAWNARERHLAAMLATLRLQAHLRGHRAKIVVWAHNRSVGDARALDPTRSQVSMGQLVREAKGDDVRLIGFTTYGGAVVAADEWGGAADVKRLLPAQAGSFEELFHRVGLPRFFLPFPSGADLCDVLAEARPERAVGLVYRPEQERCSHYRQARIAQQFDAVLHVDETQALEPLELVSEWDVVEHPVAHSPGR